VFQKKHPQKTEIDLLLFAYPHRIVGPSPKRRV
jgi:hypothetical protein